MMLRRVALKQASTCCNFLTKKQTTSPSYSLLSSFRSTYSSQSDLAGSNFVEQVDIQNAQPTSGISIDRSGLYNPPEHSHEPASKSKLIKLIKAYAYGESWYWEDRYSNQSGSFDWYQKYPSLAPLINLYIPRHHQILVTGCGNSAFSEGMVNDGYDDVVNIDISSVVIEAMQKKYANTPQLKYNQMDVRDMSAFQKGSFDAVIDKGTLDSLLCGFNSEQNAVKMLKEVITNYRVLKDQGVYILVTYGAPIYRLRLLRDSCLWRTKLHVIEKRVGVSEHPKWELTNPVPLDDDDGASVEAALGKNPDVHYIYICIKEASLKPHQEDEVSASEKQ